MHLRLAIPTDAAGVQQLVQRAYRGEEARVGWTHEADLLEGERVSLAEIEALIADPRERLLLGHDDGHLIGCVRVGDLGGGLASFGLLAVEPRRQVGGLGSGLITAAETLARAAFGADRIELTVIDTRARLIAYYERRGYARGEARPFPYPIERRITMIAMTKPLTGADR